MQIVSADASCVNQRSTARSPFQSFPPHCFHSFAMPLQAGLGAAGVSRVFGVSGAPDNATDGLATSFVVLACVEEDSWNGADVGFTASVRIVVAIGCPGRATGSSLVEIEDVADAVRVVCATMAELGSREVVAWTSLVLLGLLAALLGATTDVLEAEVLVTVSTASEASSAVVSAAVKVVLPELVGLRVEEGGMVLVLVLVSASVSDSDSSPMSVSVSEGTSLTTVPVATASSSPELTLVIVDPADVTLLAVGLAIATPVSVSSAS